MEDDAIDVCGSSKQTLNQTVEGVTSDSQEIGGCAYVDFKNTSGEVERSFHLLLSNSHQNGEQCDEQGKCKKLLF